MYGGAPAPMMFPPLPYPGGFPVMPAPALPSPTPPPPLSSLPPPIPGLQPRPAVTPMAPAPFTPLQDRPFSHFVRNVAPNPAPSQLEFFSENLKEEFCDSYLRGGQRYMTMLKEHPMRTLPILAAGVGMGALLTALHRHNHVIETGLLFLLLGYPVAFALRQLPKMEEAYEAVAQGNPTQGKTMFREALDELVYQVLHVCLKPFTVAAVVVGLLRLPENIRRIQAGQGYLAIFQPVLKALRINDRTGPLKALDRIYHPLEHVGNQAENLLHKATFGLFKTR